MDNLLFLRRNQLIIKMKKIYHVDLTETEVAYLEEIIKTRTKNSVQVKRSYILLASNRSGDKSWPDSKIASTYLVGRATVERLRERLVLEGLEIALNGHSYYQNKDKIVFDGEVESKLIALRCVEPESGSSGWSLRFLADKMVELSYVESISRESVRKILKKTKLSLGKKKNG